MFNASFAQSDCTCCLGVDPDGYGMKLIAEFDQMSPDS